MKKANQLTLQQNEDIEKVAEILKNKDVSEKITLEYEGNQQGKPFRWIVKRRFLNGYPLIHAQEIYGNPNNLLTEKRTFEALNKLVHQKKVMLKSHKGLFWYVWIGDENQKKK